MGFLTTVVVHNDRLHEFKANPTQFALDLFALMDAANAERDRAHDCGGYVKAFPSRHADDHTVYVHSGNGLQDLSPRALELLIARNPEWAVQVVKEAEAIVKDAKRRLKAAGVKARR